MRTRARIAVHDGHEICRLDADLPADPYPPDVFDAKVDAVPVWAKTSKEPRVFFVRMNNSARALPDDERAPPTKPTADREVERERGATCSIPPLT